MLRCAHKRTDSLRLAYTFSVVALVMQTAVASQAGAADQIPQRMKPCWLGFHLQHKAPRLAQTERRKREREEERWKDRWQCWKQNEALKE